MHVSRNDEGHITITLENHEEIVALWAVAAHVGGERIAPRLMFSNNDPEKLGLTQQLAPWVTMPTAAKERYGITSKTPPARVQDTLTAMFGSVLVGSLNFHKTTDECVSV